MTITQGTNVIAKTSTFMDLKDVKDMFEHTHAENVTASVPPSSLVSRMVLDNSLPTDTSGHSYADHYWHSAEFRGDYWQEQSYWHTLLYSSTYGFNISNP